ncbi:hypothetical protein QVD17_35067 [Tagetes erecta]|uniref:Uncharacterized protein n=1 Tax=Tagetes erecta TaxID=13708 RepID=A0AAD8NEV0_TARER|nr:hypothetical protein QVD17_35067 [Tagetes erecta]
MRSRAYMNNVPPNWYSIVEVLIARAKSKRLINVLGPILVVATAYFMWQERNNRMFSDLSSPPDSLCDAITDVIHYRLMGLKLKRTIQVVRLLEERNVHGESLFDDRGGRFY